MGEGRQPPLDQDETAGQLLGVGHFQVGRVVGDLGERELPANSTAKKTTTLTPTNAAHRKTGAT
ncbi:hypothetical protein [Streptomyces canus]|uniref:hypothetical protein n=1 Tax=Streptomyces canus TaxID=58343 RepID=UPI002B1E2B1D|nr:hypothetical protein [Streptomyces canus]